MLKIIFFWNRIVEVCQKLFKFLPKIMNESYFFSPSNVCIPSFFSTIYRLQEQLKQVHHLWFETFFYTFHQSRRLEHTTLSFAAQQTHLTRYLLTFDRTQTKDEKKTGKRAKPGTYTSMATTPIVSTRYLCCLCNPSGLLLLPGVGLLLHKVCWTFKVGAWQLLGHDGRFLFWRRIGFWHRFANILSLYL